MLPSKFPLRPMDCLIDKEELVVVQHGVIGRWAIDSAVKIQSSEVFFLDMENFDIFVTSQIDPLVI